MIVLSLGVFRHEELGGETVSRADTFILSNSCIGSN